MGISLQKGGNINLSKEAPGLSKVVVGLGWDVRATDGVDFDLDASIFMVDESGKVRNDADFIFYGQKDSACGAVHHQGDNRTGEGDGDDEAIDVNLAGLPAEIKKLVVAVTIHEAKKHGLNFGMVSEAFVRILNGADGTEIARFDLSEDASMNTAMIFGELYRNGNDWKFKAIGEGFEGGLSPLATSYGVSVG